MLVKIRHRADQYREVGLSPAIVAHCWGVSRYQSRRAARNPRLLRHALRHGEAHAAKGLTAFGASLTRNSLFLRATGLIQNNEDVKVVQELLRHANSRITLDLYAQAGMPEKRRAQSKVVKMVLDKESAVA